MDEFRNPEPKNRDTGLSTATLAGVHEQDHPTTEDFARTDEKNNGVNARNAATTANRNGDSAEADYQSTPLFSPGEATDFRARWDAVQVGFVDEPRHAVEEADGLVAAAMKRLAEMFADERQKLESQWGRGDQVSTEDLRVALRRYRSFFGRLLCI
ncbi:MAG TPA: hypothetical protein VKR52_15275 [Terracidiphilus sp.]|nr:hypothetical protein [Terracidiphilus sp.]